MSDGSAANSISPHRPATPKRQPIRTCVACRTAGGKRGLLRVVRLPDEGGVVLDPTGKKSGRGAYVCPTLACVTTALKRKALERSLKVSVSTEVADALRQAVAEADDIEAGEKESAAGNAAASVADTEARMPPGTLPVP